MVKSPPLTSRKKRWAKGRDVTLRGQQLNYNAALQNRYARSLNMLIREMTDTTKKQITRLFRSRTADNYFDKQDELAAMDESISSQARILMNKLTDKFVQLFSIRAKRLADSMLKNTLKVSASTLHGSLKQLSGGLTLKTGVVTEGTEEVATAIVAENVSAH